MVIGLSLLLLACSDSDTNEATAEAEPSAAAQDLYKSKAEIGANTPKSHPSYSISDFTDAEQPKISAEALAELHRQRQQDLHHQEIDRRVRQIEQNKEMRRAENDLRKANERADELRQSIPLSDVEPYQVPR